MGVTGWIICIGIGLFGIFTFSRLSHYNRLFREISLKSKGVYKQTKSGARVNIDSGNYGYDVRNELDPEAMNDLRDKYHAAIADYMTYVQFISLFPLLGLFGTVVGLIPGLKAVNEGNLEVLSGSLSTALISTLIGLVISIFLKVYVGYGPSRLTENIENNFEETDRRYDYALGFGKVTREEQ